MCRFLFALLTVKTKSANKWRTYCFCLVYLQVFWCLIWNFRMNVSFRIFHSVIERTLFCKFHRGRFTIDQSALVSQLPPKRKEIFLLLFLENSIVEGRSTDNHAIRKWENRFIRPKPEVYLPIDAENHMENTWGLENWFLCPTFSLHIDFDGISSYREC